LWTSTTPDAPSSSALDDFARIDRRGVDRPRSHRLVADHDVAVVEEDHPELLGETVRHRGVKIIEQRLPAAEYRPIDRRRL